MQHAAPLQRIHDFSAANQCGDGQTTSQRLAERYEIGRKLVVLLTASGRNTKPCNSLVEDENNSVRLCQLLQSGEISVGWRDHSDICHYSFADDRRDLAAMVLDRALQRRQVVPRHNNGVIERGSIQAGTVWNPNRIAA